MKLQQSSYLNANFPKGILLPNFCAWQTEKTHLNATKKEVIRNPRVYVKNILHHAICLIWPFASIANIMRFLDHAIISQANSRKLHHLVDLNWKVYIEFMGRRIHVQSETLH